MWVQLDQNVRSREHSRTYQLESAIPADLSPQARQFLELDTFDGGYDLTRVEIVQGRGTTPADYRIDDTIMKINLPTPVKSGQTVSFDIDWSYRIPDDGRGAKEMVKDGWLYEMAQWFPRMSVYDDVQGWQTDQFLGQGEFYLNFGTYDVKLTVPWNHIVEATGVLQNDREVLTAEQRRRLARAYQSEEPTFIIAADEVMTPASRPTQSGTQTWHFKANDVRDFAWVSSKTYVWDAAGYTNPGETTPIVVHSLYPRDAMPLWDKVSTRATIQTLKTYGEMSFPYPYPKAANVHGPVFGMEYPMISFCGARPDDDGNYSDGLERALIGVTIHEVGHNWFPMIVASDERQHTWMDEGLNSFLEYYGRHEYAQTYCGEQWTQTADCSWPASRGDASQIVGYMRDPDQVPIMAESDVVHRGFGSNAYGKPATGLIMLREKVLGHQAFDEAFRFYSTQWMFKHPQPADFFRSMEEGSGENLDWFWRGWFYTTNANDQTLADVSQQDASELTDDASRGANYYRVQVDNSGGIVMPIELEFRYADGTMDRRVVPADVWRNNEKTHTVGMFSDKQLAVVVLDPDQAFADINPADNLWIAPTMTDAEVEAMGLMRPLTPSRQPSTPVRSWASSVRSRSSSPSTGRSSSSRSTGKAPSA